MSGGVHLRNTAPKKRRSGSASLATLCPIQLAGESNPWPPAPIAMRLTAELTDWFKMQVLSI